VNIFLKLGLSGKGMRAVNHV